MNEPLDPKNTICVLRSNGKEIGRIAATASNANAYIQELVQHYKCVEIQYEEDKDAAMISRFLSSPRY